LIGKRLGSYEITAKLGEGGMGEVSRATDTRLKRAVAIKVLPAAFTEDKARLARFEREAQLLAQPNHPNILSTPSPVADREKRADRGRARLERPARAQFAMIGTRLGPGAISAEPVEGTARIGAMRPQSVDTSPEVESIQIQLFREMGPRGRLAAAFELNAALDVLALAGIRSRHGGLPESEARLRLYALRLSREQMIRAFAWDPAGV